MSRTIAIPYDIYESEDHLMCLIPMGGVAKSSVKINLSDYTLHVHAERHRPDTTDTFIQLQQECYR
jgi:HSP20 family molecular chaperone IbpA